MNFGIELFRLIVVTGETFGRVRDVYATVHGTFHGTEDSGTGGGTGKPGIETGSEGSGSINGIFDHEVIAVNVGLTFVQAVEAQFIEDLKAQDVFQAASSKNIGRILALI